MQWPITLPCFELCPYINISFVWWHGLQDPGTYPIPVRETTSEDPSVSSSKTLIYLQSTILGNGLFVTPLKPNQILQSRQLSQATCQGETLAIRDLLREHYAEMKAPQPVTEMKKSQGDFSWSGMGLTMNWLAKKYSSISIDREMIL